MVNVGLTTEEVNTLVGIVHVVQNGGASDVHLILKGISVHLVVVLASLAEGVLDELLVLILVTIGPDNDGVDGVKRIMNVLNYTQSSNNKCLLCSPCRHLRRWRCQHQTRAPVPST